jgi:hypothetical protein
MYRARGRYRAKRWSKAAEAQSVQQNSSRQWSKAAGKGEEIGPEAGIMPTDIQTYRDNKVSSTYPGFP